jgi:hypothetical protein
MTMKRLLTAATIALLPAVAMAQTPLPVGSVTMSSPTTLTTLDMDKLKGNPSRMAWSPDLTQIYLQTIEGPFHQPKAVRHYIVTASDGKVKDVQAEPEWFQAYWSVKSHKASPDAPALEIALSTENRREQTTSVPRGGDLAKGGSVGADVTGTSTGDAAAAAMNSQTVTVHTMKLHGQTIGEFVNAVIVPGLTFAWAPKGTQAIAYTDPKGGKIYLMDPKGKKQDLDGTKDALLPMWSHDAKKLAWLQKDGKKKFELKVADIR